MAIINRLRFVDTLRPRLGDQVARDFVEALQDEMSPLVTDEQVRLILDSLLPQIDARMAELENRMWRIVAIATGLTIGTLLTALGIATGLIIALD